MTGDWGALGALQHRLDEAKRAGLIQEAAKVIGAAAYKLVADEFKESRAPDGAPWAPVQRNRKRDRAARGRRAASGRTVRGDKPLIDTGRLRGSLANHTAGSTVRLSLPVVYAPFHQFGTRRMVQRQILPTGQLPPHWSSLFEKETMKLVQRRLKGK